MKTDIIPQNRVDTLSDAVRNEELITFKWVESLNGAISKVQYSKKRVVRYIQFSIPNKPNIFVYQYCDKDQLSYWAVEQGEESEFKNIDTLKYKQQLLSELRKFGWSDKMAEEVVQDTITFKWVSSLYNACPHDGYVEFAPKIMVSYGYDNYATPCWKVSQANQNQTVYTKDQLVAALEKFGWSDRKEEPGLDNDLDLPAGVHLEDQYDLDWLKALPQCTKAIGHYVYFHIRSGNAKHRNYIHCSCNVDSYDWSLNLGYSNGIVHDIIPMATIKTKQEVLNLLKFFQN